MNRQQFEPGDYVAWYMGLAQIRGHVVDILQGGDEIIVRSVAGVRWNLMPSYQQIDLLGPIDGDSVMKVELP